MRFAAAVAVLALAACASRPPPLVAPDHVESFCSSPAPGGAVVPILSSVEDRPLNVPFPSDEELHRNLADFNGVIGHWAAQPFFMPRTAATLGVGGQYIDITAVAIDNQLDADSRLIYVTVASPKGPVHVTLRAYDTEDACGAGPSPEP